MFSIPPTDLIPHNIFQSFPIKFNLPNGWVDSDPNIKTLKSGKIPEIREFSFEEIEAAGEVPFNEILPGLYLGNRYGAGRILGKKTAEALEIIKNRLVEHGISTIVCCTEDSEHYFSDEEFQYIDIPLFDHDMPLFDVIKKEIIDSIDDKINEGGVFIHCGAGVSRSASFLIIYLAKKFPNLTYNQILNFLKSKRNCVQPNEYFQKTLRNHIDSQTKYI